MPASEGPTARKTDARLTPSASVQGRTVLLAEDDAEHRLIYCRVLQAGGYSVIAARTGPGALEQTLQSRPDAVVVDISVPGTDGWEVTRRITASAELRDVPVIVVTVHSYPGDREQSYAAGCTIHLDKPARPTEVLAAVDQVLGIDRGGVG